MYIAFDDAGPRLGRTATRSWWTFVGTTATLAGLDDMKTTRLDLDTPVVGPPVIDPVVSPEPIKKPDPKPSPEGTSEFWKHVIR
jgi:hypothetical protein